MNPGRFDTLSKFRAVHLGKAIYCRGFNFTNASMHADAKQATYEMWFACKRLNRKVRRVWRASKVGSAWLPQELVDHIVDYVSDDGPTLFACTHLSRTWCIAARAHLYRTFTVSDYFGFEAIDDLQSMGIIDLVRKVVAVRKVNWQADFLTPSTMERLHTFTRVQELDIRYLDVGAPLLWLHEHGDILRSTVRFLTLRYPRGSIKEIACFIGSFPKLEDLTVDGIGVDIFRDSQVPAIRRSLPFTGRLTLIRISDQEFPSALSTSMQNGVGFRTVDLQLCVEMQELVDACAGTMERLICHPSDFHGTYKFLYSVTGESNINCQALRTWTCRGAIPSATSRSTSAP